VNQRVSTTKPPRAGDKAGMYRWIALFIVLAATIGGILVYWRHAELYPSTNNAYTGANTVRVASQVSGSVADVYVINDDKVAAGDPLFDIDPSLYDAALRNARAQFDAAADAAGTAADALKGAANKLEEKQAALESAMTKYREAKNAQKEGEAPSPALTEALEAWHGAVKDFDDAQAAFDTEQDKKITVTTPTVKLRAASAALDKSMQDRVRTYVTAPGSGWVSKINLRPGSIVQAGTPALALVEDGNWWVDANFKETDLGRIKPGQAATISLDMYPGATFEGVVESISPGSGASFSVLPPENATGNWVKVTQRFPVRIEITSPPDPDKPLRLGASATVRIDTTEPAQSTQ
jgi:membrane fusion protein (multidrug efflux system)